VGDLEELAALPRLDLIRYRGETKNTTLANGVRIAYSSMSCETE
jgi:hypothetical protein